MKNLILLLLALASINFAKAQWQLSSTGNTSVITYCFIEVPGGILAGTANGIFNSTDSGSTWSVSTAWGTCAFGQNSAGIFAGYDTIHFSTNGGASWTTVLNNSNPVFAFAFLTDTVFAATLGGGVMMSANNGATWSAVNTGLPTDSVYSIVAKGDLLFAGTIGDGVYVSSNAGASWSASNNGLPSNVNIRCLSTDGTNLYAGTDDWSSAPQGLYISANNGGLWTQVTTGIPTTNSVFSVTKVGHALLAASGDVYRSLDSGATWQDFSNGINCTFGSIGFLETASYVFCGMEESTCSGSVYRINLNEVLSVNEIEENHFSIYPNPLISSSTLQLNTQVNNAEVVIYDVLGKEMMRKKLTGDRMEIEKGSLESGVYFLTVRDNERQYVQKLVVE